MSKPAFGPVALVFGFVCAFAVFSPNIARAVIVVSCIADSAAGLLGKAIGRHRIPYSPRKTLEGTAAGFISSLTFALLCLDPVSALAAAATASLIESLPFGDLDNLVMPLGTGCVLTMIA